MTAYWKIRARLLRVPGVANVPIWGERLEMLQVQADPKRLAEQKVTLEQVMTVTADALDAGLQSSTRRGTSSDAAAGSKARPQRLGVRHVQPIVSHEDLANLPINTQDGRTIRLERRGRPGPGPPTAHRRRGYQRGRRPDAHRREAALGEHPGRDQGRRGGTRRAASRACPGSPSIRRSSGRRPSSRTRSTT